MIKVYLHGALAQFGEVFELEVRDCAEAVTALASQIYGFADCIASGDWSVVIGDVESGDSITDESLTIALKDGASIHIIPAIAGAGGIISAVVGITKIAWGASTGNWNMVKSGFNQAKGGVTSLFSTTPVTPDYATRAEADERPSFLYDGATNTSVQGLPVPVIYGRVRAGSIVVSAGLSSEKI